VNVPAVEKVFVNVLSVSRLPLSKLPLISVAVCGVESLFVQVTVPPNFTCTTAGEKAKFSILTEAAATGVEPFEVGLVELFELLPQLVNKKRPDMITRVKKMILIFIKVYLLYYTMKTHFNEKRLPVG
jgi:hypothetical protein